MTIVDHSNEQSQLLVDVFGKIGLLRGKTVVVSFCQVVVDNAPALHVALVDIHFMEMVGIRPVIIHGPDERMHMALRDAGFKSTGGDHSSMDQAATMGVVEKLLAEELNGLLANEFEKIGGRAMTLNFESTPVLNGDSIEADSHAMAGVGMIAYGRVTHVDRLVIDNLSYARQVPFIPAMCLGETGQKLLVNPDSTAATVAIQLNAEILIAFAEFPAEFSNNTDPHPHRLELSLPAVDGLMPPLARELETVVTTCGTAIRQGIGKLIIADTQQRHSILLNMFTAAGWGIEMVGA
jgi:acetylglutamate kinase